MRSPYSQSRTTQVLTPDDPKSHVEGTKRAREVKARQPTEGPTAGESKRRLEEEIQTPQASATKPEVVAWDPFVDESISVTAKSDAGKFEYEHWGDNETNGRNDCRAACSDGTETVAAFGDAVSEVFDLINEVAFPGVIDSAADGRLIRDGESYDEDDDSIFIRSKSYDNREKAREFLDFIGAARRRNQKIVTTPLPPQDLLRPSGAPLGLPSIKETLVPLALPSIRETFLPSSLPSTEETVIPVEPRGQDARDDDICDKDDSAMVEQAGKSMKMQEDETPREKPLNIDRVDREKFGGHQLNRKQRDRYSSLISSDDSEDWSDGESENAGEDDYQNYINDVLHNKEKPETTPRNPARLGSVQSLVNSARNKYTTSHRLKKIKEQSELLTIAESMYEDEDEDEDEFVDPQEVLREIIRDEDDRNDDEDEEDYVDPEEVLRDIIRYDVNERSDDDLEYTEKTDFVDESDYYSSAVSESSFSSYEQRYEEASEESFVDDSTASFEESDYSMSIYDEGESFTNHTRSTLGKKDSLVDREDVEECIRDTLHTRSSEVEESSYEEEEDEDEDDSDNDDDDDDESSGQSNTSEKKDMIAASRTHSVAESLLKEDDEEEYNEDDKRHINFTPGTSKFCSVYDHLYSADSLFSFITQDETNDTKDTLFDFVESTTEKHVRPPMIIMPDLSITTTDQEDENSQNEDEEEEEAEREQEKAEEQMEEEEEDRRDLEEGKREEQIQEQKEEKDERHTLSEEENLFDSPRCYPSNTREEADDEIEQSREESVKGVEANDGNEENEEKVSRVSKTFSSVLYGGKRHVPTSNSVSERRRQWPPRRAPVVRNDSMIQTKSVSENLREKKGEITIPDEHSRRRSNSNNSRCSMSSNESSQVNTVDEKLRSNNPSMNPVKLVTKSLDHQIMRKRSLARMRRYNQQKENAARLQQEAPE